MSSKLWLLAMIAACGRWRFEPVDTAIPPNQLVVRVVSDPTTNLDGGEPIAGASVIVAGTIFATDAEGIVHLEATAPVSFDVVYLRDSRWRVYSVLDALPGAQVALGGRLGAGVRLQSMMLQMAAGPGATYEVELPSHCGGSSSATSTPIKVVFHPTCEGQDVRASTLNFDAAGGWSLAPFTLTLANATTATAPGAFMPLPLQQTTFTNLPASTTTLTTHLMTFDAGDYRPASDSTSTPVAGSSVTVAHHADTFDSIDVGAHLVTQASSSNALLPYAATIDASSLMPFIFDLANANGVITWSPFGPTAANAMLLEVFFENDPVDFTAIAPPTTTVLSFPTLPPELAAAIPSHLGEASGALVIYEVPEATYESLLPDADARLGVSNNLTVLPPGVLSTTSSFFF